MAGIDLLIFDLDGVLIDSELISAEVILAELAAQGAHADLAFFFRHLLGRPFAQVERRVAELFGVTLPPTFEAAYLSRLLSRFSRELRAMPHVHEILAHLDIPYCIATSSGRERAMRSLEVAGFPKPGERLFLTSMVANGKPAPDIFLLAASRHNTEPGRCLVIEDSDTGIRAARAAGMRVWRFTGGSHFRAAANAIGDETADLAIDDMRRLPALLGG